MAIQGAIGTYLLGYAGLTSIIGQSLYPVRAPDDIAPPYAVYSCESEEPDENTLEGTHPRSIFLLRIEVVTNDYDQAWEIIRQLRLALTGHLGTMSGIENVGIMFEGASDSDSPQFGLFSPEVRFQVSYPA